MKCPTCFRGLPDDVEFLACSQCEAVPSASLNAEYGGRDVRVPVVFPAEQGECSKCGTASDIEACRACHGLVPGVWRRPNTTVSCVAMAGARNTGKSIYLGVVRQQLELWVEECHRSTLELIGDTESHYMQRYGGALFDDGVILSPTAELSLDPHGHVPLIFRFVDDSGRARILVLRDVAGEDLENLAQRRVALAFVKEADAVVILIDPLKMDRLRESLRGIIHPGDLGGDGVEVVDQMLALITRDGRDPVPEGQRLAVAVSKVDVLQQVKDIPGAPLRPVMVRSGSPLQRDPSMTTAQFDTHDADLLNAEVASVLVELTGLKLGHLLRHGGVEHRYFAVSALGAHPEGTRLNSAGIAPFRVLDPIKWVLS